MKTARRIALALSFPLLLGAAMPDDGERRYSQGREELIIRHFFQDRRDGFFLDVGCAHPEKFSTTYYLEKHLGWHGIGVDAAEKFGPGWKRLRPRSRFLNYLVTDHDGDEEPFFLAGYAYVSSKHEQMVKNVPHREVRVQTATLDSILAREGVERIDFLSLDIEGAQLEALRGFDIERYAPSLVAIEHHLPDRRAIWEYFDQRGYVWLTQYLRYDWVNHYYARKDQPYPRIDGFPENVATEAHSIDSRTPEDFYLQGRDSLRKNDCAAVLWLWGAYQGSVVELPTEREGEVEAGLARCRAEILRDTRGESTRSGPEPDLSGKPATVTPRE